MKVAVGSTMDVCTEANQLVGTTVAGRYRIDALVEETGLSLIYRATHLALHRNVALKVFKGGAGLHADARRELLECFVREGAVLGELSKVCSAICKPGDAGSFTAPDGASMPYLALEWLDGETLDVVLARERRRGDRARSPEEAAGLLRPIAAALACAHSRGITHRDVKPGNIMTLRDESSRRTPRCKLLDFGIAKLSSDASSSSQGVARAFTPGYAAPEQFDSRIGVTGPWTDVYALALILVELICQRAALRGERIWSLAQCSCDPGTRPTPRTLGVPVSDEVEAALRRALAVDPRDRPRDMQTFWTEFSRAARGPSAGRSGPPAAEARVPFEPSRPRPARPDLRAAASAAG